MYLITSYNIDIKWKMNPYKLAFFVFFLAKNSYKN